MAHFFCLALEAGFSSYMVECLHVDPETINSIPMQLEQVGFFLLFETCQTV